MALRAREPLSALLRRLAVELWPSAGSGTSVPCFEQLAVRHAGGGAPPTSGCRLLSVAAGESLSAGVRAAEVASGSAKSLQGSSHAQRWRQREGLHGSMRGATAQPRHFAHQCLSSGRSIHSSRAVQRGADEKHPTKKTGKSTRLSAKQEADAAAKAAAAEAAPPPVSSASTEHGISPD